MRHPLRLLESAEVAAPVAVGVIGDYVLLPTGWAESLGEDEMLAVLCHESAHLARRDHYVVILQELFASVLWFHPLVHLFNRMLNRVREEVCDNYAIAMIERPAYCEALLAPCRRPSREVCAWRHFDVDASLVARRSDPGNPGPAATHQNQDFGFRPLRDGDHFGSDLRPHCHAATDRVTARRSDQDNDPVRLFATRRMPVRPQTK